MPNWMHATALPCLAVAAVLAGCGPPSDKFAPACPELRLLPDGADLMNFSERGRDITDMVMSARISAVPAECSAGSRGRVKATIRVMLDITRGPAMRGKSATIPWFVTVLDGDR